ncbi:unnamed protein product [Spirodela intermedia]|uniref:Uncharacterized protein n=1 Tax=Spirodela intermedia TaxID=51605 RepID=A0A7I8J9M2_SPIIN|nr:unnamed protein product [Spirodela intermedia]CAA6666789.1 unnamed protein product [Spirodela intermedia]
MSTMTSKILGARFEALKADNENLRADQRRMVEDIQKVREESMDLMPQLLQNILEALEKKEHHNLQPTSSYDQHTQNHDTMYHFLTLLKNIF